MRVLLIVAAILVLFALVGWITFHSEPGRSSINLETDEIREDTGQIMRGGAELLQDAEEEITGDATATDRASSKTK
jgi:hypothetical protein